MLSDGGVKPFFHPTIFRRKPEIDKGEISRMQQRYMRFLDSIEASGYLQGDDCIMITSKPIAMTCEGTHRMGWLLSHNANFWIKAKFTGSDSFNPYSENGEKFSREHYMSENDLKKIMDRYNELYTKMNRGYVAVFNADVFNRYNIKDWFDRNGFDIEITDSFDIDRQKRGILKRYGIYTGFCEAVICRININRATYHYKSGGILISEENIRLRKELTEQAGDNWGGITDTVTETILLERELFDIGANKTKKKTWKKKISDIFHIVFT